MERKVVFEKLYEQTGNLIQEIFSLRDAYYDALLDLFTRNEYQSKDDDLSFINNCIVQLKEVDDRLSKMKLDVNYRECDDLPFY